MPWQEATKMSLRREFVTLALADGANIRRLCRRYGISHVTGYKWIKRYQQAGAAGLQDRSRRPHTSPKRTSPEMEQAVLSVRDTHPAWGGRKIHARLIATGIDNIPQPSTITEILRRHGRLDPEEGKKHRPWQRFEAEAPNSLWQMDFKGHFPLARGGRCHPLTVLDDHSRFALGLQACGDERGKTVQAELGDIFRRYGMPEQMLMDNGGPWGTSQEHPYTSFTAWLIRLGINVIHSSPYHPQSIGKDERFHRTVQAEVLGGRIFQDLDHCQQNFDSWRDVYNLERPHQALEMAVPASRYRESEQVFPETLMPIEYGPEDIVRKVDEKGKISYLGRRFRISKAFYGYPVALRPTCFDGIFNVYFCHQKVKQIDMGNNYPEDKKC